MKIKFTTLKRQSSAATVISLQERRGRSRSPRGGLNTRRISSAPWQWKSEAVAVDVSLELRYAARFLTSKAINCDIEIATFRAAVFSAHLELPYPPLDHDRIWGTLCPRAIPAPCRKEYQVTVFPNQTFTSTLSYIYRFINIYLYIIKIHIYKLSFLRCARLSWHDKVIIVSEHQRL